MTRCAFTMAMPVPIILIPLCHDIEAALIPCLPVDSLFQARNLVGNVLGMGGQSRRNLVNSPKRCFGSSRLITAVSTFHHRRQVTQYHARMSMDLHNKAQHVSVSIPCKQCLYVCMYAHDSLQCDGYAMAINLRKRRLGFCHRHYGLISEVANQQEDRLRIFQFSSTPIHSCDTSLFARYSCGPVDRCDGADSLHPSGPAVLGKARKFTDGSYSDQTASNCDGKKYRGFLHKDIQSCLEGILA